MITRIALASLVLMSGIARADFSPFELPWMNNDEETVFSSEDHPDGIFVIEAYFKDCPYCVQNAPNVNQLSEDYQDEERVLVLDVGIDTRDSDYRWWIRETEPNHPVLKDARRDLIRQLGTRSYPSTYIANCRGEIVYSHRGTWSASTKNRIRSEIDQLLSEDCS